MRMQAALNMWVQAGRLSRKRIKYKLGSQEILRSISNSFWMRPPVFLLQQFLLQLASKIKKLSKAQGLWTPTMFIKIYCKYEAFTSLLITGHTKWGNNSSANCHSITVLVWLCHIGKIIFNNLYIWKWINDRYFNDLKSMYILYYSLDNRVRWKVRSNWLLLEGHFKCSVKTNANKIFAYI